MQGTEFVTARVRAAVREAKSVDVEDYKQLMDSSGQSINSERAFFTVVAYPWGVEFDFPDEEETK